MKKKFSSFIAVHKNGFALLKLVHELDRNALPCSLLYAVIKALVPYVSIILSASIIDLLLASSYRLAIIVAAIMVGIILVAEVAAAFIGYATGVSNNVLQERLKIRIRETFMDLDYASTDDPEALKAIRNAEMAAQYNGGLGALVRAYRDLLQYLLSSVTAIVLTIELCFSMAENVNGYLGVLSHPATVILILVSAWFLGMKLTKAQAAVIKKMDDEIAAEHYKAENNLGYWMMALLMDLQVGKNMRVGGMKEIIQKNASGWMAALTPLYINMGVGSRKKIVADGIETGLFSVVAYFLVLVKVLAKAISVGSFTKYSGALLQLNQAGSKIVWSETVINRLSVNLVPMMDFLQQKNKMETGSIHVEKRLDNEFEIEFKDVGFQYPGSDEFVLRHVNAKITLKNKLAVVGRNGAGKSTFIKLLVRLYDPTEGVITLNGVDIRKYNYQEYLKLFGIVFQNYYLFGYSIAENVAVSTEYDREKLTKCLEQAGALEFVETLPKGMETAIRRGEEDGIDLSGGQSQKISIARALYKDAPFVILDEPTAALDPISEAEIYERFDEMVHDKTSIYISHRMSSCRFCDEILVFDKGEICERGSHEDLLDMEGLYASLWRAQAKYYA